MDVYTVLRSVVAAILKTYDPEFWQTGPSVEIFDNGTTLMIEVSREQEGSDGRHK